MRRCVPHGSLPLAGEGRGRGGGNEARHASSLPRKQASEKRNGELGQPAEFSSSTSPCPSPQEEERCGTVSSLLHRHIRVTPATMCACRTARSEISPAALPWPTPSTPCKSSGVTEGHFFTKATIFQISSSPHAARCEARHAGHLDAVLDHPEQLTRLALSPGISLEVGAGRAAALPTTSPSRRHGAPWQLTQPRVTHRRAPASPRWHPRPASERRQWRAIDAWRTWMSMRSTSAGSASVAATL